MKNPESTLGSIKYRNRVRGLLSNTRQRGFGIDDRVRSDRLKVSMRAILLEARTTIPHGHYDEHLKWLYSQVPHTPGSSPLFLGTGLTYTNIPSTRTDIATELSWVSMRLVSAADTLNKHLSLRQEISLALLENDEQTVSKCFDEVLNSVGDSHWYISTKLSALQTLGGLTAQKEFLSDLREKAKRGITAVYAYHVSIRNEPSASLAWFINDIRSRRFSTKNPEHRTYLRFTLLGEVPDSFEKISDILRVEQSHSDVDVYETSISLLQSLSLRALPIEINNSCKSFIEVIRGSIFDPRIEKLALQFGLTVNPGAIPKANEQLILDFLDGSNSKPECPDSRSLTDDPAYVLWYSIKDAFTKRDTHGSPEAGPSESLLQKVLANFQQLSARGDEFTAAKTWLAKEGRNLEGLPFGRFLALLSTAANRRTLFKLAENLAPASLGVNSFGILDIINLRINSRTDAGYEPADDLELFAACLAGSNHVASDQWTSAAAGLASLKRDSFDQDFSKSEEFAAELIAANSDASKSWSKVVSLEIFKQDYRYEDSLSLVGQWASGLSPQGAELPIDSALESLGASHITKFGGVITTPIALDAWRAEGDHENKQTLLRMAFNKFMKSSGYTHPSSIPIDVIRSSPGEYAYFLGKICVPNIMDMNPAFKSSHQLLVERSKICALLRNEDSANQVQYDEQLVTITQTLSIWEGLKLVDGSRIHVDERGFTEAVLSELSGTFDRYATLVKAGVGVADDYDVVLRNLIRQEGYAEGLAVPDNEADELLVRMVIRMKEMFLGNNIYGLNGYVSKRIRHGSLIGHLRGPVTRHKVITQRSNNKSEYERNHYWLHQLTSNDVDAVEKLAAAMSDFSRMFDRELLQLKDEKLQIKRDKSADGVLDFPLTAATLHVIRSSLKTDLSLDGLVKGALVLFWTLLRPALEEAQDLVKNRFQRKASELFNRLQGNAHTLIKDDEIYPHFVNAIRQASEETQVQIATVAGWFDRSGVDDHHKTYSLEDAVQISIESAKKAFPDFDPYVVKRCDPVVMPGPALQLIADVLLIAVGNIHEHSGLGKDPAIEITGKIDSTRDTATFIVESNVAEGVRNDSSEANLHRIREKILRRDFELAATEGNSGFLKLGAMVYQSDSGNLEFGFTDAGFRVEITMSFIIDHDASEEANG